MGVVELTLERLGIDEEGLDAMDRKVLETVAVKFDGGPVGIDSLSTAIGEEADTIEDVYEPFLIMRGLLQRRTSDRMRAGVCRASRARSADVTIKQVALSVSTQQSSRWRG